MEDRSYDAAIVGVGIGSNYGSVLTYYSLYRTIESFGKSALMVSKIAAKDGDTHLREDHALRFARRHLNLSKVYEPSNTKDLSSIANTFVIGSDQVWNYGVSPVAGRAFYLDFVPDNKRKISYAASFGHAKDFAPDGVRTELSQLFRRFNAISVREDSGVTLAGQCYGVEAKQTIEPIFLTASEEYLKLAEHSERNVSEPYLVAYVLDPTPEKREAIKYLCRKLNLKPRIILDGWSHLFAENKAKMGMDDAVEEGIETYDFLKLYANASYVFTDSFHGTCFALKFNKPYATIGNRRRGIARFDSLFRQIGNRDRFTLDAKDIVADGDRFLAPMNFAPLNKKLDMQVSDSKAWLKEALDIPTTTHVNPYSKPAVPLQNIGRLKRKFRTALQYVSSQKRYRSNQPKFETNTNAWSISEQTGASRLNCDLDGRHPRGHQTWCALPIPLVPAQTYELSIKWGVQTSSGTINLHVRKPSDGTFKVIGRLPGGTDRTVVRTDRVRFQVNSEGFTEFMLGAVHFLGPDAGADIEQMTLRRVVGHPGDAMGLQTEKPRKSPADVARDLSKADSQRFVKHYAQRMIAKNESNSRALLMFHSHGLEKGLSRGSDFRPGFGEAALKPLAKVMNTWVSEKKDIQDSFYQIAASVLKYYFDRHKSIGFDTAHIQALFSADVIHHIEEADPSIGGAAPADRQRDSLPHTLKNRTFSDVVFSRRSVRNFTEQPLDDKKVHTAIQIALQAPSVCNRQAVRVHMFDDQSAIKAALDLQGGFRGYKMPPRLLLVTSHLPSFLFAVERNQPFIDGGLFMMLLLLGLEQVGLGSVCLNTAMSHEKETAIRKILGVPETDVFISFVAIGHFEPDVSVPRSMRVAASEVLIDHRDRKSLAAE